MPPPVKPSAAVRTISQSAFDEMVLENIEILSMDPNEALQDAIETLTLQSVNLSGLILSLPGQANPAMDCIKKLKKLNESSSSVVAGVVDEVMREIVCLDGNGVQVVVRNGGLDLVCGICSKVSSDGADGVVSVFEAMALLIYGSFI